MGLRIMRYRAEMCGGTLEIANHPAGGVRLRCTFRDRTVDPATTPPA
jgi:signal transduction histidine kinase